MCQSNHTFVACSVSSCPLFAPIAHTAASPVVLCNDEPCNFEESVTVILSAPLKGLNLEDFRLALQEV